jgi:hypothetical protein
MFSGQMASDVPQHTPDIFVTGYILAKFQYLHQPIKPADWRSGSAPGS